MTSLKSFEAYCTIESGEIIRDPIEDHYYFVFEPTGGFPYVKI